jgi:TPR repeat protein
MPPSRKRAAQPSAADGTAEEAKRYRSAIDEMADEFVCSITQELPVDPVTAEDGRIYERDAIASWIETRQRGGQPLRSPATNEAMGAKLVPSVQARNAIKRMVESGAITGAKADAWKARIEGEKKVAELRRKAEAGDVQAMKDLGFAYRDALHDLKTDVSEFYFWFKKAADLEDPSAMTVYGFAQICGLSHVAENVPAGFMALGYAAAKGSAGACYGLGTCYNLELGGLTADEREITKWYRKMLACPVRDVSDTARAETEAWLRDHPQRA